MVLLIGRGPDYFNWQYSSAELSYKLHYVEQLMYCICSALLLFANSVSSVQVNFDTSLHSLAFYFNIEKSHTVSSLLINLLLCKKNCIQAPNKNELKLYVLLFFQFPLKKSHLLGG